MVEHPLRARAERTRKRRRHQTRGRCGKKSKSGSCASKGNLSCELRSEKKVIAPVNRRYTSVRLDWETQQEPSTRLQRCKKTLRSIISALKPVDLATVDEAGVILCACTWVLDREPPEIFVWFPEPRNELFKVSNRDVPDYLFMASRNGMLCGLHYDTIRNYLEDGHPAGDPDYYIAGWTLRFAVWNPAVGSVVELPLLLPLESERHFSPPVAFEEGKLQVSMDSDASVHVLLYNRSLLSFVVYSHKQGSQEWARGPLSEFEPVRHRGRDEPLVGDFAVRLLNLHLYDTKSRSWSSVAAPGSGERWNAYPMPPELGSKGYEYRVMHPVVYGSRLFMTGMCYGPDDFHVVILEQQNGDAWEIVAWTECCSASRSRSNDFHQASFPSTVPRLCGSVLVFPSNFFFNPTAFHLEKSTWLELPPAVFDLPLQLYTTFQPAM